MLSIFSVQEGEAAAEKRPAAPQPELAEEADAADLTQARC